MTHIAITEHRDGTTVQWMEKVTDEQYNAAPKTQAAQQQGTSRPLENVSNGSHPASPR